MNTKQIYSYSILLFEMGINTKKIKEFFTQICFLIKKIRSTKLIDFLSNLNISKNIRKEVFNDLFKRNLDKNIIYFIWTAIDFNRAKFLEKIFFDFLEIYDDYFGILCIKVISPYELSQQQLKKIELSLHKKFNQKIVLNNIVDPSVIGGIKIESKNLSIDNTFKKKLNIIKEKTISPIEQRN